MSTRKSGPARTPSALNELRGNPGHRKKPANEPKPRAAGVAVPAMIANDPIAVRVWEEHVPELLRIGLLTVLDRQALSAACLLWAMFERAMTALGPDAELVFRARGTVQARPEVQVALRAQAEAMSAFAQFGMAGPSSRTSLNSPEPLAPTAAPSLPAAGKKARNLGDNPGATQATDMEAFLRKREGRAQTA